MSLDALYLVKLIFGEYFYLNSNLVAASLAIPVGDAIWDCRRSFFFFFLLPRFCPGHIFGTVICRDSKLSVLLGPAV